MTYHVRIVASGNVEVPAYLTFLEMGYCVQCEQNSSGDLWIARHDDCEFVANGPIELLGVVVGYEKRGNEWRATDQQIGEFMRMYYP